MPLRAIDGEIDVLSAALVELVAVALLQQLAERGHLAQRFLQVVGGHVGELLQLGVGAAQLGGLGVQVGGLAGGAACAARLRPASAATSSLRIASTSAATARRSAGPDGSMRWP